MSAPAAIDDLDASAGTESILFDWSDPDDGGSSITKFTLYRGGVPFADVITHPHEVLAAPGYDLTGPWVVTATNGDGESNPSNEITVPVPDAVDDLAAAEDEHKLTFTWSEPDDHDFPVIRYALYRGGLLHTDDVTSPHEVTGLAGGFPSGPWTLIATNAAGDSDPSNAVTETPDRSDETIHGGGNRRRLSGHRSLITGPSAPTPLSIRDAWAVYESDTGASITGHGPTLAGGSYQAGIIGAGVSPGSPYAQVSEVPGINLALDHSIGFWLQITSDSFSIPEAFGAKVLLNNIAKQCALSINYTDESIIRFFYTRIDDIQDPADYRPLTLSEGYHHFAVSYSAAGNLAQLYLDGVAVGSPTNVGTGATPDPHPLLTPKVQISNQDGNGLSGPHCQTVVAAVAYTADEWLYLYNGGLGRAYLTWNT